MGGKHTPGPWTITGGFPDKCITVDALQSELSEAIALVPCDDVTDEQGRQIEANARLIAAAPDLLKACRGALAALKGREHDQFIRDAIAKADSSQ